MRLERYHGLGNDYLVLADGALLPVGAAALVVAICDRHTGAGSDGILQPAPAGPCDFGVTIWNPDGSIGEKSGNGLRIYARWLVDSGQAGPSFSVWTGSERVGCEVGPDAIAIEMGSARFAPADVPVIADGPLIEGPLDDELGPYTAVGLGNPHAVRFCTEPLDDLPWRAWGAKVEVHPRFPNRTNTQVARVIDRHTVEARIWERGAGETLASGSSACAVAAAAVKTGRCDHGWVRVVMPGGDLRVEVRPDGTLRLEGPVERVGAVILDEGWLARRSARTG